MVRSAQVEDELITRAKKAYSDAEDAIADWLEMTRRHEEAVSPRPHATVTAASAKWSRHSR